MNLEQERWQRLSTLFGQALDGDAAQRAALLATLGRDEPDLAAELARMLAAAEGSGPLDAGAEALLDAGLPVDAPVDESGQRLGPWRLVRMLGHGGMGCVYEAQREDDSGQRAAIKRLQPQWAGTAQARRFLEERAILARLSHPGIPALIDHGIDTQARPWFALEYVDGGNLLHHADARQLDLRQRVALLRQVCAAVQHAHAHLVVHRDLKPANLLVDGEGRARVLDFGVAKRLDSADSATRTGVHAGFTPEYAAPEQILGQPVSVATDVHALGVVLYELLCGQRPWQFDPVNLRDTAQAIVTRTPTRMEAALGAGEPDAVATRLANRRTSSAAFRRFVRGDLGRILQTALAKEPERRYGSVQALADDLLRFLQGRPVSVSGDGAGYRARKFVQRNRWGVAMAALALLAMLAGLSGTVWQLRQARTQRDAALAESRRNAAVGDYFAMLFRDAGDRIDGERATVSEALADGARRITESYRDDPATGIQLAVTTADLSQRLGDLKAAQALYEQALGWPDIARFPDQRASAQYGLGVVRYFNGDNAGARTQLAQALAYWRRNPRRHAVNLQESAALQANLARADGHAEDAAKVLEQAIAARRAQLGDGPDRIVAARMADLAGAYLGMGEAARARDTAQAAWRMFEQLRLPSTSDAIGALNNAAVASVQLGDLAGAEQSFRRAADIYRQANPQSPHLASLLSNLGTLELKSGRLDEARADLEQALDMGIRLGGESSRVAMGTRLRLAELLAKQGRPADASALLATQMRLATAQGDTTSPVHAGGLLLRARLRLDAGDHTGARADLDTLDGLLAALGPTGAAIGAQAKAQRARLR